ncbi:MAG: hypothetical protein HYV07_19000 [Deltaproteobacteria bacterium]|nr:hypothetical protein [Deltaproteobacteria bacterium]
MRKVGVFGPGPHLPRSLARRVIAAASEPGTKRLARVLAPLTRRVVEWRGVKSLSRNRIELSRTTEWLGIWLVSWAGPALAAPPYWDTETASVAASSTTAVRVSVEPPKLSELDSTPAVGPDGPVEQPSKPKLPDPPAKVLAFWPGGTWLAFPLELSTRFEGFGSVLIDGPRTIRESRELSTQLRLGMTFDSRLVFVPLLLAAELEGEAQLRALEARSEPEGVGFAEPPDSELLPRKAWVRASLGPYLHVGGGLMTSAWGLGLLANDGTRSTDPTQLTDPRGGDRSVRGFIASGPVTDRKLFLSLAFDSVVEDDVLLAGDEATQFVMAAIIGRREPTWAGAYVVHRSLRGVDGDETSAWVIDFSGRYEAHPSDRLKLTVEGEIAGILGTTQLAATVDVPEHAVRQVGGVIRGTLEGRELGCSVDLFFASGDGDLDDDAQTAFKADPRFEEGLLLFRSVLSARTARAAYRANNLELVGEPPEDLERFPTRGSVSNTMALFPRVLYRPSSAFELYGGVLLALAMAPVLDPLETRLSGGSPRAFNAQEADGRYLGTELDVGFRIRAPYSGGEAALAVEGGTFFPGGALTAGPGVSEVTHGGRAILRVSL